METGWPTNLQKASCISPHMGNPNLSSAFTTEHIEFIYIQLSRIRVGFIIKLPHSVKFKEKKNPRSESRIRNLSQDQYLESAGDGSTVRLLLRTEEASSDVLDGHQVPLCPRVSAHDPLILSLFLLLFFFLRSRDLRGFRRFGGRIELPLRFLSCIHNVWIKEGDNSG